MLPVCHKCSVMEHPSFSCYYIDALVRTVVVSTAIFCKRSLRQACLFEGVIGQACNIFTIRTNSKQFCNSSPLRLSCASFEKVSVCLAHPGRIFLANMARACHIQCVESPGRVLQHVMTEQYSNGMPNSKILRELASGLFYIDSRLPYEIARSTYITATDRYFDTIASDCLPLANPIVLSSRFLIATTARN